MQEAYDNENIIMNPITRGALIGLASGLTVALGGAIKDAPYEGFDLLKFFRSPAIGLVEGSVLGHYQPKLNVPVFYFAIIGTERVTTETYKLIRAKLDEVKYMPAKFKVGEWGITKKVL